MPKEEKKSCRNCAYLNYFFAADLDTPKIFWESLRCRRDGSSINKGELDSKSCKEFIRKREGMTLEQQKLQHEQIRWSNRLRRNWYYVSALVIGIIGLIIAIWRFLLNN